MPIKIKPSAPPRHGDAPGLPFGKPAWHGRPQPLPATQSQSQRQGCAAPAAPQGPALGSTFGLVEYPA